MELYSELEVQYDNSGTPCHCTPQPELESSTDHIESSSNQQEASHLDIKAESEKTKSRPRFFIHKLRLLYAIIAFVAVVVASTLGGVLGSRKYHQYHQVTKASSTLLHARSSISASGWVDTSTQVAHRAVYFQDSYSSIIARVWQSDTRNWETWNLTDRQINPAIAIPGTSLASGSLSLNNVTKTGVWYFGVENTIEWLGHFDQPNFGTFSKGFSSSDSAIHENSNLAVIPNLCAGNCTAGWILAFQNAESQVEFKAASIYNGFLTNDVDYSYPSGIATGSSMVFLPLGLDPSPSVFSLIVEALTSSEGGDMVSKTLNSSSSDATVWQDGGTLMKSLPAPSSHLQFTGTILNDWFNVALALLPNGTITGALLNQTHLITNYDTFDFGDGPSADFTAIAMTLDGTLYAIFNDTVVEYDVMFFPDGTVHFNYTGVIF